MNKKIFVTLLSMLVLSGCQKPLTYGELMQRPELLQKEYEDCRGQTSTQCDEVVRAAEDFRLLVQQREEDPEAFGYRIIQAEQNGDEKKVRVLHAVVRATSPE